jgi:hypothetical protein
MPTMQLTVLRPFSFSDPVFRASSDDLNDLAFISVPLVPAVPNGNGTEEIPGLDVMLV